MTVIGTIRDADGNLRCPWHDHLLATEDGINYECPENALIQRAIEQDLARVLGSDRTA